MSIYGPTLTKSGRLTVADASLDKISALLLSGPPVGGGAQQGTTYKVLSLGEAEALGLDRDYDIDNSVLVWHHIRDFYRLAGSGTELYIRLYAQTTTMDQLATQATAMLSDAAGRIRLLGVGRVPDGAYVEDVTAGIEAEVLDAIPVFNTLARTAYTDHRPLNIAIEGRHLNGAVSGYPDLRALAGGDAEKVSVVVAQDPAVAALDPEYTYYAQVGAFLGSLAARAVHESIGWPGASTNNILDASVPANLTCGLSDNTLVQSKFTDWAALDAKGYVFARPFQGRDGFFWNDAHTASALTNIENNAQNGRVLDKASRVLYLRALDFYKRPEVLDAAGLLPEAARTEIEEILAQELDLWLTDNGEISARRVTIDPTSDLVNPPRELRILFEVVPAGQIDRINGTINLTSSL